MHIEFNSISEDLIDCITKIEASGMRSIKYIVLEEQEIIELSAGLPGVFKNENRMIYGTYMGVTLVSRKYHKAQLMNKISL